MSGTRTVPLSLCPGAAPAHLPDRSAVLGPCSPAAAIHLALGFLDLASLVPFGSVRPAPSCSWSYKLTQQDDATEKDDSSRALIITGPRHQLQSAIDAEDEPALRGPLPALARVDVRYCPSWRHAALLLSLLSGDLNPAAPELVEKPGLIVLADVSALFDADVDEAKENVPPPPPAGAGDPAGGAGGAGEEEHSGKEEPRHLSQDAWQYLSLVSAAKQAAAALGAALVVLEHHPAPLPLPASPTGRSVEMHAALHKLLGHVVTVSGKLDCLSLQLTAESPEEGEKGVYEVRQGGDVWRMARRQVSKHEYALPPVRTAAEEVAHAWSWL